MGIFGLFLLLTLFQKSSVKIRKENVKVRRKYAVKIGRNSSCRFLLFLTFRDTDSDKTLDLGLHRQSLKRVENILVGLLVELEPNEACVFLVVFLLRSRFFLADKKSRPLLTFGAKRDIMETMRAAASPPKSFFDLSSGVIRRSFSFCLSSLLRQ